jgi:hypothetical protein
MGDEEAEFVTEEEAHASVIAYLRTLQSENDESPTGFVVTRVREENFGWVFYYAARKEAEGEKVELRFGGLPRVIIVDRATGALHLAPNGHHTWVGQYREYWPVRHRFATFPRSLRQPPSTGPKAELPFRRIQRPADDSKWRK